MVEVVEEVVHQTLAVIAKADKEVEALLEAVEVVWSAVDGELMLLPDILEEVTHARLDAPSVLIHVVSEDELTGIVVGVDVLVHVPIHSVVSEVAGSDAISHILEEPLVESALLHLLERHNLFATEDLLAQVVEIHLGDEVVLGEALDRPDDVAVHHRVEFVETLLDEFVGTAFTEVLDPLADVQGEDAEEVGGPSRLALADEAVEEGGASGLDDTPRGVDSPEDVVEVDLAKLQPGVAMVELVVNDAP